MTSSKEVFELRRAGKLAEAYEMALHRMAAPNRDAWDDRAFGWCLVDLVKKHAAAGAGPELAGYISQLKTLAVPEDDEILTKQRGFALSLMQPGSLELQQAREHSKNGQFRSAIEIYDKLFRRGLLDATNHTNYGWDLFKETSLVFKKASGEQLPPRVVTDAKQNLNAYMKLTTEKPSLLHSCMLQQAMRLASGDHLKVMVFARMWGLENLRQEDFDRYVADDGKSLPSLAEKVIQQASKEAAAEHRRDQIEYILPFVEKTMDRFPDNIWLKLNRVKILRELGRHDEARALALDFAKAKAGEYWAWELLGDLQVEPEQRLACYCKALICSQDDNFVSKLRGKLAHHLIKAGHSSEAKGEIQRVIEHKQAVGQRLPADIELLTQEPWYADAVSAIPKPAFYARYAPQADELLFSDLPWIDACIGDRFVIEGQEGKPRRKLYLKTKSLPAEVSIQESKLRLRTISTGLPVKVRADYDPKAAQRFTLYSTAPRGDGTPFDIFTETVGVVDHVDLAKRILHYIASRDVHGTISFADYAGEAAIGDSVALRLASFQSRKGAGIHALSVTPTKSAPSTQVCKPFRATVRVDKGMGFTSDGIFIPPDLVAAHAIENDDVVSGIAALNYNKKREIWGWKAIIINEEIPKDSISDHEANSLRG